MTGRGPGLVVEVDTTDPTPPFEQIRRQLEHLVAAGLLAPGTRLPPVRQLAADLGLAPGTVARAYSELESAGVLTTRRGGGTTVAPRAVSDPVAQEPGGGPARESALAAAAATYVRTARELGADDATVLRHVGVALRAPRAT